MSRDVVIIACAISAGIHAALVSDHTAFAPTAALLGGVAVALNRGHTAIAVDLAIALLGGLIVAYALAVTVGIPLLHTEPEPIDGVGLATKAIEATGLLAALNLKGQLTWPLGTRHARFRSR